MEVKNREQVFNIFDTNGRRGDVINAYNIYTNLLEQVYEESESGVWGRYPNESTQFQFYRLAIESSPEVFKQHPKYDNFVKAMENPAIKEEFDKGDISYLKTKPELYALYKDLDTNIEGRARHYTSNLVKIGLADEQRRISPVGSSWIHGKKLRRSRFEKLLPIDDTNLIFFRQLVKLRVYTKDGEKYYSPMLMAMYILLKNERVSQDLFITMVQMLNPYLEKDPAEFVEEFLNGHAQKMEREYVPFDSSEALVEITDESIPMSSESFFKHFGSGKSEKASEIYQEFYICLVTFNENRSIESLERLNDLFADPQKKSMLNKAFGFGRNIFNFDRRDRSKVSKFMGLNKELDILTNDGLNEKLYLQFQASKRHDAIQEYGDVTRRVMKVTGVISFKNGIVEIAQRDLWLKFFDKIEVENLIFRKSTSEQYEYYEKDLSSPFLNHLTIEEILGYDNTKVDSTIDKIKEELNLNSEEEIQKTLYDQTSRAFITHIEENYPEEKVLEILPLFSDRKNDSAIQKMVSENTDVPTIFEFIVGIAWYHISSKKFDLFSSLNLSLSADFEPETHAGGGAGDIVIDYGDHIMMIEVTMMNKQAQKRGEWEPVLRHATNLTIESAPKEVTTLFVADVLDENTINIWRAIATVPLQSSKNTGEVAESVTIMPLKNQELVKMLENKIDENTLLTRIKESFGQLTSDFNLEWRKEILKDLR